MTDGTIYGRVPPRHNPEPVRGSRRHLGLTRGADRGIRPATSIEALERSLFAPDKEVRTTGEARLTGVRHLNRP